MKLYDIQPLSGYQPEIGLLLSALNDSTREWRENLGQVPDGVISWQPVEASYNIGTLILHLIDSEDYWLRNVVGGLERDDADTKLFLSQELDQYGGVWPKPPAKPLSWYLELHDRIRQRAVACLVDVAPSKEIAREGRDYNVTARWVVAHVLEHDSYTGGQAVAVHEMWRKLHG